MIELVDAGLREEFFRLYSWMIQELNRLAVDGLIDHPGTYRQTEMVIDGSKHQPPKWVDVPKYVDLMCTYVNENWSRSPVHLASYVMWRLNWIHPFTDGNGRTARAISYLVMSVRIGQRIPGKSTIPDRISADKQPYYEALEAADRSQKKRSDAVNLSEMESLLSKFLVDQVQEAAQSELPRESHERRSVTTPTGHRSWSFFSRNKAVVIGAAAVILAAIITGLFSMLSTDPGQRLLLPDSAPSQTPTR